MKKYIALSALFIAAIYLFAVNGFVIARVKNESGHDLSEMVISFCGKEVRVEYVGDGEIREFRSAAGCEGSFSVSYQGGGVKNSFKNIGYIVSYGPPQLHELTIRKDEIDAQYIGLRFY